MRSNDQFNEKLRIKEQDLFNILSHTTRRMILRELNNQYYLAYSELQELIPQSPGVIYHHLEKLQAKGLIQQRESKEYELTPLGVQAFSYLEKLQDDDVPSLVTPLSAFQNIFLTVPLSQLVPRNPLRWAMEISVLAVLLFLIQIDFPVLIVGPFLLPSTLPLFSRVFIEIIVFSSMFLLLGFISAFFSKKPRKTFPLLSGLLILPLLSLVATFILFVISMALSVVPSLFFWLLTMILQFCYVYVIIHILIKILRLSFDKSVIITLLMGYFFLICVFIFG